MPENTDIFDLDRADAYGRWRESKLRSAVTDPGQLVVEVEDIAAPTAAECHALKARVRRHSMAIYAERPRPGRDDRLALMGLASSLGLRSIDANQLADDDGITPLSVHRHGPRSRYIPYSERPITWHTDGYYNPCERPVRAVLLHCTRPAADGGANRLLDHELLYILLRDHDPGLIRALMAPDAMTIPGNDDEGMIRPAIEGPVFSVDGSGHLHMRYTARSRSIGWSSAAVGAAAAIREILDGPSPHVLCHRLEAGQGLVSSNPLHTREPFRDDPDRPRLLYRARYHDRI